MRVLIVEDEPYLAEAIRDGLRLEAIAADIAGRLDDLRRRRQKREDMRGGP
jgi:DNA-binding response OmpR family regulator